MEKKREVQVTFFHVVEIEYIVDMKVSSDMNDDDVYSMAYDLMDDDNKGGEQGIELKEGSIEDV